MKYGHSNLLGETIEAGLLDYSDYRTFQIVCPVCRENVFKVVRDVLPAPIHYLSHYAAAQAYAADCELRVAGFSQREIEQQNLISRGQKIDLFLRVLRDAIKRFEYVGNPATKIKSLFWTLERSKPLSFMFELFVSVAPRLDEATFQASTEVYIHQDVGADHPMWRTGFALRTQQRIAHDLWRNLVTFPARSNLRFLWHHGYSMVLARLQASVDSGAIDPPSQKLRVYAEKLLQSSRAGGMALIVEMNNIPAPQPFALEGTFYFSKLMSEVTHEMIGCLLRLPYFKILEEQQKNHDNNSK